MARRFIFSAVVFMAFPLVILTWIMEELAKFSLVIFGVWWGLCFMVLNREQRREYAASWTRFATKFVRDNPNDVWTMRVLAFTEHAVKAAEES